jgi:hypothetical protein
MGLNAYFDCNGVADQVNFRIFQYYISYIDY